MYNFFRPQRRINILLTIFPSPLQRFLTLVRFFSKTFFQMRWVVGFLGFIWFWFFPSLFSDKAIFTLMPILQTRMVPKVTRQQREERQPSKPEFLISALSKLGHDVNEILNYCCCVPSPATCLTRLGPRCSPHSHKTAS